MTFDYSFYYGLALVITAIVAIVTVPDARKRLSVIIMLIVLPSMLPILPDHTIDPWNLFNPRKFCMLIVTISIIQFGGYLAVTFLGRRKGLSLSGFIGGIISSTAVFASLPVTLKNYRGFEYAIAASSLLAVVATLSEMIVVLFVASHTFLLYVIKPLLGMIITGTTLSLILLKKQKHLPHTHNDHINPINVRAVIHLSLFLSATLIMIVIAKRFLGTKGLIALTFLGGLFEIHGVTLASTLLYVENNLKIADAALALYTAIFASFVSKFFLLAILTPYRFAVGTSLLLLTILSVGGVLIML